MASFVTTYMVRRLEFPSHLSQWKEEETIGQTNTTQEEEAEKLMTESFPKNFIDYEEYPQSADIQNRCVSMIGRLFHAPEENGGAGAVGTSCVGSSEAILLAVLAMRKRWKNKRLEAGLSADRPNIIMSSGEL